MTDASRTPARTVSNPNQRRVITATRTEPLPPEPPKPLGKRLTEGLVDFGDQLLSFVREGVTDFKSRDRYFKYKALIVATYVLLSVTTFGVACPGSTITTQDMGARVVVGGAADRPIWLIKNESDEEWKDVVVVINGTYRAAVGVLPAQKDLAVTPLQLIGDNQRAAPSDLRAVTLELKTGEGNVMLIEEGRVIE